MMMNSVRAAAVAVSTRRLVASAPPVCRFASAAQSALADSTLSTPPKSPQDLVRSAIQRMLKEEKQSSSKAPIVSSEVPAASTAASLEAASTPTSSIQKSLAELQYRLLDVRACVQDCYELIPSQPTMLFQDDDTLATLSTKSPVQLALEEALQDEIRHTEHALESLVMQYTDWLDDWRTHVKSSVNSSTEDLNVGSQEIAAGIRQIRAELGSIQQRFGPPVPATTRQ
jgi:hypothetical protein